MKMKFCFFLTRDYIFVATWHVATWHVAHFVLTCPKQKFGVTHTYTHTHTHTYTHKNDMAKKKNNVAQKIGWCQQKQVDIARKSVSCQQKTWCSSKRYFMSTETRWCCTKKYFALKKVISFFPEWPTIFLYRSSLPLAKSNIINSIWENVFKSTLMQIWKSPHMFVFNKNNTPKISHS